jgi:serine/threonine protein kinase
VTDKYELGKKMGDGNFAIVHRSKLRGTEREYAIKIIDKSKMKVKITFFFSKNKFNFFFYK